MSEKTESRGRPRKGLDLNRRLELYRAYLGLIRRQELALGAGQVAEFAELARERDQVQAALDSEGPSVLDPSDTSAPQDRWVLEQISDIVREAVVRDRTLRDGLMRLREQTREVLRSVEKGGANVRHYLDQAVVRDQASPRINLRL